MSRDIEALAKLVGSNFASLDDGRSIYLTPIGEVRDMDGKMIYPADPGRAKLYKKNKEQAPGGGVTREEFDRLSEEISCDEPYKQLVTDGDGKTVWEDRLGYKMLEPTSRAMDETVTFTNGVSPYKGWLDSIATELSNGECTLRVIFDGTSYDVLEHVDLGSGGLIGYIGNASLNPDAPGEDTGEPFLFLYPQAYNAYNLIYTNAGDGDHTIVVWLMEETTHPIPPDYLTGAPLTETDEGKVLAVVDGAIGLKSPDLKVVFRCTSSGAVSVNVDYSTLWYAMQDHKPIEAYIDTPSDDNTNFTIAPCALRLLYVSRGWCGIIASALSTKATSEDDYAGSVIVQHKVVWKESEDPTYSSTDVFTES